METQRLSTQDGFAADIRKGMRTGGSPTFVRRHPAGSLSALCRRPTRPHVPIRQNPAVHPVGTRSGRRLPGTGGALLPRRATSRRPVYPIQLIQPIFARAFALVLEGLSENLVHRLTSCCHYVVLSVHPLIVVGTSRVWVASINIASERDHCNQ